MLNPTPNIFYGEMYMYEASQTVTINTANVYHGVYGFSGAAAKGFVFNSGSNIDANINSESDATQLQITTSAAHGLSTGDVVTLSNMNDTGHNGPTVITVVNSTNFTCDDIAYVAGAGASAGVVDQPCWLEAGQFIHGIYLVSLSVSGQSAGTNKRYRWEIFRNAIEFPESAIERIHANTDTGSMSNSAIVEIEDDDKIWIACEGLTDATDFTIEHASLAIHKL